MGISRVIGFGPKKLSQTSMEQATLRSIQALEVELSAEQDGKRREELVDQINDLKSGIAEIGTNVSFMEREVLTNKVIELKKEIIFLKSQIRNSQNITPALTAGSDEDDNISGRYRLYELLLNKYSDLINEFEKKTVGEIKAMVNADDLTVQSIVGDFKKDGYEFEKDYFEAAKKAFGFISSEIMFASSGIDLNFWLSPKEIMNKKVGDDEDIAVFLCSVLMALGDHNAEVVIAELENMSTHAFVITDIGEKFFILDPAQKLEFEKFCGEKTMVLANYVFNGSKIKRFLYKFNAQKYEQFV